MYEFEELFFMIIKTNFVQLQRGCMAGALVKTSIISDKLFKDMSESCLHVFFWKPSCRRAGGI